MSTTGTSNVKPDRVSAVRTFTRFYTVVLGVLEEGLLHTPYSVTEARVIFELAQRDATDVADLRRGLRVDAGYMSRITGRFEADGLITRERSSADAAAGTAPHGARAGSVRNAQRALRRAGRAAARSGVRG